jgi:hypothetical protein
LDGLAMSENFIERRSEPRDYIDEYYSVEFSIRENPYTYQFKIWNLSAKGMCVLVRKDSGILDHLKVGDILNMKYYKADSNPKHISKPSTGYVKTQIRHITERDQKHCFVGLLILENIDSDR